MKTSGRKPDDEHLMRHASLQSRLSDGGDNIQYSVFDIHYSSPPHRYARSLAVFLVLSAGESPESITPAVD
ncbi:MAG: hypothetical protein IH876_16395 [Gemmatimonadetes bacterium]|nr:hypothetical protein [Gemmatimonadota bacterium]